MDLTRRGVLGAMGVAAVAGGVMAMAGKTEATTGGTVPNPMPGVGGLKPRIIDVRMRPPFAPYVGEGRMFDRNATHPMALTKLTYAFGATVSPSMWEASMEKLFQEMDSVGDITGVVSIRVNDKGFENDALVDLLAQYPDRFLGACGIPILETDKAIDVMKKYILDGPCITVFMEPGFAGVMIDDERLAPTFEFCQANKIPMLISYGGFHGPTDEFCQPIHAQNVAEKFPDLKMCLCHACWPWVDAAVRLAYRCPNVYLSPDIYMLHSAGAQSYTEAANYMLREKFLYGSAYPVVDVVTSVNTYLQKLRPEIMEDIMFNNAVKFFGLNV